ncbi:hypothetical protein ABTC20_19090, partial [Acinetobacter baumannii]
GRAKLSLNPTTGYHGSPERVFNAFAAGTAAMTTDGPFWHSLPAGLPLRYRSERPLAGLPRNMAGLPTDMDLRHLAERGHALLAEQH